MQNHNTTNHERDFWDRELQREYDLIDAAQARHATTRKYRDDDGGPYLEGYDVAAAIGAHPYASPITPYQKYTSIAQPAEPSEAAHLRSAIACAIRCEYGRRHNLFVAKPLKATWATQEDWARAHADGLINRGQHSWGLEVATTEIRSDYRWGKSGTDQVPIEVLVKCIWNMWVHDFDRWDVAVMIGSDDYREYTVRRTEAHESYVVAAARRFWFGHVKTRTPPPIDGSADYHEYLVAQYPHVRDDLLQPSEHTDAIAHKLREIRDAERELAAERAHTENQLKAHIGDAGGVKLTDGGAITWRPRRGREITDWESVARESAADAEWPADKLERCRSLHTRRASSSRPLGVPRCWHRRVAIGSRARTTTLN